MPHNPGLSEKAWKEFNRFMARMNLKYGPKKAAALKKQTPTDAA